MTVVNIWSDKRRGLCVIAKLRNIAIHDSNIFSNIFSVMSSYILAKKAIYQRNAKELIKLLKGKFK